MNRLLMVALVAFAFVGCSKEKEDKALDIIGDWNIVGISTKTTEIGGVTVDVWLSFNKDKTFVLYQMIGQGRYTSYGGKWELTGSRLTGKYSDGKAWGSDYEVSLEDSGNTLVLTSSKGEVDTYTKGVVPSNVLGNIR